MEGRDLKGFVYIEKSCCLAVIEDENEFLLIIEFWKPRATDPVRTGL